MKKANRATAGLTDEQLMERKEASSNSPLLSAKAAELNGRDVARAQEQGPRLPSLSSTGCTAVIDRCAWTEPGRKPRPHFPMALLYLDFQ